MGIGVNDFELFPHRLAPAADYESTLFDLDGWCQGGDGSLCKAGEHLVTGDPR